MSDTILVDLTWDKLLSAGCLIRYFGLIYWWFEVSCVLSVASRDEKICYIFIPNYVPIFRPLTLAKVHTYAISIAVHGTRYMKYCNSKYLVKKFHVRLYSILRLIKF